MERNEESVAGEGLQMRVNATLLGNKVKGETGEQRERPEVAFAREAASLPWAMVPRVQEGGVRAFDVSRGVQQS